MPRKVSTEPCLNPASAPCATWTATEAGRASGVAKETGAASRAMNPVRTARPSASPRLVRPACARRIRALLTEHSGVIIQGSGLECERSHNYCIAIILAESETGHDRRGGRHSRALLETFIGHLHDPMRVLPPPVLSGDGPTTTSCITRVIGRPMS